MDTRMLAVINSLERDLSNLEKALIRTRALLKELAKEARKNDTTTQTQPRLAPPARSYLANQQPRHDGTFPLSYWENDDAD